MVLINLRTAYIYSFLRYLRNSVEVIDWTDHVQGEIQIFNDLNVAVVGAPG
jgi:hypothetical protein